MKKTRVAEQLKEAKEELEKQETTILDKQEEIMESFLSFLVEYYKTVGEREILHNQHEVFEKLPVNEKKELKKIFRKLYRDKECLKRELVRFDDMWWVEDEYRTHAEDYELQVPRACTFDSTTPCAPTSHKFLRALQIMQSKIYALLYHYGFEVPEFNEHWKDNAHKKRERVFDIEVNLSDRAAQAMNVMKAEIEKYGKLLKELDRLYEFREKELNLRIFEDRKKMWDSL